MYASLLVLCTIGDVFSKAVMLAASTLTIGLAASGAFQPRLGHFASLPAHSAHVDKAAGAMLACLSSPHYIWLRRFRLNRPDIFAIIFAARLMEYTLPHFHFFVGKCARGEFSSVSGATFDAH